MAFDSVADFIAMGGHGVFVWLSYGIVFFSIALYLVHLRVFGRRVERQIRQLAEREANQAGESQ